MPSTTHVSLRSQVAELLQEISAQELRLKELRAKLQPLQLQLDAITYPVLTLPPEITSDIFVHCLPSVLSSKDTVNVAEAPLLLLQICSQWRRIALFTPELWARLEIDVQARFDYVSDIARTWLNRAGNRPLSLRIEGPICSIKKFSAFSETFHQSTKQIRSLDLIVPIDDLITMNTHRLDFPLLRDLSIGLLEHEHFSDLSEDPIESFRGVSLLDQAHLRHIPTDLIVLPWQNLRKFTGEFYEFSEGTEALRLMPNLTECALSVCQTYEDIHAITPLSHPEMRAFTLFRSRSKTDWNTRACTADFLVVVTFPNLTTLELVEVEDYDPLDLHNFLARSSPPLQRLVVRPGPDVGPGEVELSSPIFRQSHLTELEIWYPASYLANKFFESIQDSTFAPGLEKICFHCRYRDDEDDGALVVEMAGKPVTERRRLDGVAQLRVFHVVAAAGTDFHLLKDLTDELRPFKILKAEGMDVFIGAEDGDNEV